MVYRKSFQFFLTVFILMSILCCTEEMRSDFSNMLKIRKEIAKKFNHKDIGIKIFNGKYMTVSLVNSKYNKLDRKVKEKSAREIAKYTVSLLENKNKIEKIIISFTIHERKYLIVNYTNSLDSYSFEVSDLQKELNGGQPNQVNSTDAKNRAAD